MQRMMLYFGSFNPVHRGHIALAEYVVEQGLCDQVVLMVSPQSPYKNPAGLAPELQRFEMAELACAASRYPDQIKTSSVEFFLPRPSYTIDTLRFLEEKCGEDMCFSILMGADQIARLEGWKEWESLLRYPIYVYPRRGKKVEKHLEHITLLEDAPLWEISATDIRLRIALGEEVASLLAPSVEEYIRREGLWESEQLIEALSVQLGEEPTASLYTQRGRLYYHLNRWGDALNDFHQALQLDSSNTQAQEYIRMVEEILEFRHKDIYNP